ncbi:unnamed protein product [Caenorhabditis nigoni]
MGRRVVTLKCDEDAIFPSGVTKDTQSESGSKDGVKERLKATEVARSQAPLVFHRTEGECDICGKFLTDGLELVEVWSRRFLLYMLFKAKTIKRDRLYDLRYESRDTLIRAARSFALSCEKDPATEVPNQTNCLKTPTYSTRSRPNAET